MGDTYVPRFWPPFFTLAGSSTIFLGYFFSSTNSKAIFWGTKTTNFYKNRSFWPQIQFFPRSFWVQFSAASGTPPSVFRPSTPPGALPHTTYWYRGLYACRAGCMDWSTEHKTIFLHHSHRSQIILCMCPANQSWHHSRRQNITRVFVSISNKTSLYCRISQSLEATKFWFRIAWSLWNLTSTSAALLWMHFSNYKAMQ